MVNLKEWMRILELHQQGLSVSAIAERTDHDRKAVRKVIGSGLTLEEFENLMAVNASSERDVI